MTGAIIGGAAVLGGASIYAGHQAGKSAESAAQTSAGSQQAALDYLKEIEALPREIRERALSSLAGLYGMGEEEGVQQELIDRAQDSPLYSAIMGGQQEGEEAILRGASATGGLRSGNVNAAMYDYNVNLSNRALLESYNQQLSGLSGLSGLPSYASEIAGVQSGIGETLAQGITAGAQARQQGWGQAIGVGTQAGMGLIGLKTKGII